MPTNPDDLLGLVPASMLLRAVVGPESDDPADPPDWSAALSVARGILDLRATVDRLKAEADRDRRQISELSSTRSAGRLDEIRRLHAPRTGTALSEPDAKRRKLRCAGCGKRWPCKTRRLADFGDSEPHNGHVHVHLAQPMADGWPKAGWGNK